VVATLLVVVGVALTAGFLPARRASRVDPNTVLALRVAATSACLGAKSRGRWCLSDTFVRVSGGLRMLTYARVAVAAALTIVAVSPALLTTATRPTRFDKNHHARRHRQRVEVDEPAHVAHPRGHRSGR
jgi:hypothetical protein